jgi:uncharacterized protein (DUF362 family)
MILPKVVVRQPHDIYNYEAIREGVGEMMSFLSDRIKIPREATILLKVNLCLLMGPETGATVDPRVVRALIEWLESNFDIKKVIIAEADATHLSANMAFRALGWLDFFADKRSFVELLNLSDDKRLLVKTCYGSSVEMSEQYMRADALISVAKLKTHSLQKVTLNMKNLFGASPEKFKIKHHPRLTEAICEYSSARTPDISFVDGLIGMDGKGPVNGFPKICRLLVAGSDMLATDHFCAKLMGFRPENVPHLREAIKLNLGNRQYEVLCPELDKKNLKFTLMPRWEELFRKMVKTVRERSFRRSHGDVGKHALEV